MTFQGEFSFEAEPVQPPDIIVDQTPDQYGFYVARPVKLGTGAPITAGYGARTPQDAERMLRVMLALEEVNNTE